MTDHDKFVELQKDHVRLSVNQERADERMTRLEALLLAHVEKEEVLTERITAQLTRLNNTVLTIVVVLFAALGKDLPGILSHLF